MLGTGVPALNAALLGWLMYRSRLVPRAIPVVGLIGAPLFTSWIIGYTLGVTDGGSLWHTIAVAPIFLWELSLGLWMTFVGFSRTLAAHHCGRGRESRGPSAVVPSRTVVATKPGAA